ncbi:MAG: SH3 domain-containing protein, partial [Phormidesmis sp. CAN_BIN44]|nr:SH3 domain-containing protein [Phormidesmis sp. CAN_BIN44]
FFREASKVHPPLKVPTKPPGRVPGIHPPLQAKAILVSEYPNLDAARQFEKLIQDIGAKAKIKEVGKKAVSDARVQTPQISEKSLEQVAYETVHSEMERYANKVAKEKFDDLAGQMRDEIITELASPPPDPSQNGTDPQQQPQPATTNATIVSNKAGSKNIRSGPGTEYGVKCTAVPGDRVQILASGQDRGGYVWYKVNCPSSGVEGWIAAQLIQTD